MVNDFDSLAFRNSLQSVDDLPQPGDVLTNPYGGRCRIIAIDEPATSDEYCLDNFQITYQMGDGDIVCHKWSGVKMMLYYNDYTASTKKSKTQPNKLRVKADMAFSEMVAKQRDKNNVGKMRGSIDSDNGDLSENLDTVIDFLTECHNWNQDERLLQAIMLLCDVKKDAEMGMF